MPALPNYALRCSLPLAAVCGASIGAGCAGHTLTAIAWGIPSGLALLITVLLGLWNALQLMQLRDGRALGAWTVSASQWNRFAQRERARYLGAFNSTLVWILFGSVVFFGAVSVLCGDLDGLIVTLIGGLLLAAALAALHLWIRLRFRARSHSMQIRVGYTCFWAAGLDSFGGMQHWTERVWIDAPRGALVIQGQARANRELHPFERRIPFPPHATAQAIEVAQQLRECWGVGSGPSR